MGNSLFTKDLDSLTYEDVVHFTGISRPEPERPQEGVRLDFKVAISDDLGETVTAFANTYGGILILGVKANKRKQNIPIEIPGIAGSPDIKSTLVNKILSSVYPRPPFEVKVLEHGEQSGHVVVIVKVDESRITPHMFIAGHKNKISVRIEDNDKYASLQQIEMLFEKHEKISHQDFGYKLDELFVLGLDNSGRQGRSPNCHNLIIGPLSDLNLRLDRKMERMFGELIKRFSYKDREFDFELRDANFYQIDTQKWDSAYHRKWRLYSDGTVGFASQIGMGQPRTEYLGDMIIDVVSVFFLYKALLEKEGYWGRSYFRHGMEVHTETILQPKMPPPSSLWDDYVSYDTMEGIQLDDSAFSKLPPSQKMHSIDRYLDFSDIEEPEEIVTDNFLEHLRKIFSGSIDFEKLLEDVRRLTISWKKR